MSKVNAARLKGFVPETSFAMAVTSKNGKTAQAKKNLNEGAQKLSPLDLSLSSSLADVQNVVEGCTRCALCESRTQIVFGEGNPKPEILFVGEAPGAHEDAAGRPFVGPGGVLLDKMIEAMGLKRSAVYLLNAVKCSPPENRKPTLEEIANCAPILAAQIRILSPQVIIALGTTASQTLLKTAEPLGKLRGRVHAIHGTKLVATFHPSYLIRNQALKKDAWEDLKSAKKIIDNDFKQ